MERAITDMSQTLHSRDVSPAVQGILEEARVAYVPPHAIPSHTESLRLMEA